MIIWSKREGYIYEDERTHKRYSLLEGKCYKGECTSDSIIMFDDEEMCLANYVQGASVLYENIEELDETIKEYIDDYEAEKAKRIKEATQKKCNYRFDRYGIKAFCMNATEDIFAEMEKPHNEQSMEKFNFMVSVGNHSIRIPTGAEEWDGFEQWLARCWEANA